METVSERNARYRQIVQDLLTSMAGGPVLGTSIQDHALFDTQRDRYAVIGVGWDGDERVNELIAHVEIINGKVWVQADNTDLVIARKLEQAGVAQDDIVLGFRLPEVAEVWELAAA